MKVNCKSVTDRNPFWDSLKYLLIFTVVYGHMIETCVDNNRFNQTMYNFIYLFHMPLFVLISGHFSHLKDNRQYLLGMTHIFETYIIFQFARCIKPALTGGHFCLFPDLFIPKGILWYLVCLILWRLIIFITKESWLKSNKWVVLISFLILGLGCGFVKDINGTVSRLFALGFFFFMGYYIKDSHWVALTRKIPVWSSFLMLFCLWFLIYSFLSFDIRRVIYFGSFYNNYSISPLNYLGARIFMYIFAIVVGALLMRIVYAKPLFSSYGTYTLAIFMYHTSIIVSLRPLFANGTFLSNEAILLILSLTTCFFLTWLAHHFKIMTIMLNPISYFIRKYKNDTSVS